MVVAVDVLDFVARPNPFAVVANGGDLEGSRGGSLKC
jgi:hypothetical protein